jgi:hypothetical protein
MSRYRRATATGLSYFFTVIAYRRQPILCSDAIRNALRTAIETVRVARPFDITAWAHPPGARTSTRQRRAHPTWLEEIQQIQFTQRTKS